MYALATVPLIKRLNCNTKQIWYTDDTTATNKIANLRMWWDQLTKEGPNFGYFPNPSKIWLVTKESCHDAEISAFADMGVNITSEGRPYLGAAIESEEFVENYVSKVQSQLLAFHSAQAGNDSNDAATCSILWLLHMEFQASGSTSVAQFQTLVTS